MAAIERLERLKLLIVTGKGGVGKSTVAAAIGRLLTARGRRVLLLEVDPRESLHHLLDVQPSGGEIVPAGPGLFIQHLQPRELLDDIVRERLHLGMLARRVLESPVHQHFTEGAPGLKEAAIFGRVMKLLGGHHLGRAPRPDLVILDAPATGHGASLMAAPQLVSDVITSGPIGQLAAEIAAFVRDQSACGVVLVTMAEEMPVAEAVEHIALLAERFDRRPELVVVNALYPELPPELCDDDDPTVELWRRRHEVNEHELGSLRRHWDGPLAEVPLLPIDPGPALVGAIGRHLAQVLG